MSGGGFEQASAQWDSDDDVGFRMFAPDRLQMSSVDKRRAEIAERPLEVVDLIDFGERDVVEEALPLGLGAAMMGRGTEKESLQDELDYLLVVNSHGLDGGDSRRGRHGVR